MNNEHLAIMQQLSQQSRMIDVLLHENAFLKTIIATHLAEAAGLSDAERSFIQRITGSDAGDIASGQVAAGNPAMNISSRQLSTGNPAAYVSIGELSAGNPATQVSNRQVPAGNPAARVSSSELPAGNPATQISNGEMDAGNIDLLFAHIISNVQCLMPNASIRTVQNTAKLLLQWQSNAATHTNELCKLTGMSKDGMAKRIMSMKKAGLITRHIAPLRYEVTDKGKDLLKEHSEYYCYSPKTAAKNKG